MLYSHISCGLVLFCFLIKKKKTLERKQSCSPEERQDGRDSPNKQEISPRPPSRRDKHPEGPVDPPGKHQYLDSRFTQKIN